MRVAQPVEVERAVAPQLVVRALVRVVQERVQGGAELRRRLERPQPERVDEHETVEPVVVPRGEARGDRAAEPRAPTSTGGSAHVRSISSPSHSSIRSGSTGSTPLARQVGRDHAVAGGEAPSTRAQWVPLPPGPCSSTTGGPSPPSSSDGLGARHHQPPLDDGNALELPFAKGRGFELVVMRRRYERAARATSGAITQSARAAAMGDFTQSDEPVLVGERGRGRARRQARAWRRCCSRAARRSAR